MLLNRKQRIKLGDLKALWVGIKILIVFWGRILLNFRETRKLGRIRKMLIMIKVDLSLNIHLINLLVLAPIPSIYKIKNKPPFKIDTKISAIYKSNGKEAEISSTNIEQSIPTNSQPTKSSSKSSWMQIKDNSHKLTTQTLTFTLDPKTNSIKWRQIALTNSTSNNGTYIQLKSKDRIQNWL